jgi:NAD(P)-dependent dehydrogenase (short-subunit alcohol dehydrogenase family)
VAVERTRLRAKRDYQKWRQTKTRRRQQERSSPRGCGAKHAIKGFTESLRSELIHDGSWVRVTMVHLPGVNTT